jgi:hypothetical protein
MVNRDLNRQNNVWCINCSTGDKFTAKKWKEYYNLEEQSKLAKGPKFGCFEVGCVIGILVDIDRGSISFFKDGHDLG